ncbi:hypothetical protein GCM10010275_54290 [Streptomyces litmocidini]|uniref:hypothetical protein n=1 Tax=Streptomyces litmocidini TaxID=67318 RepID=UPI001997E560|nr:hypothetical protein [Streptomyces litmocidini]GGV07270.1 hypothetical protein GCM10010275_54290 [Streptomyces litmocidini]
MKVTSHTTTRAPSARPSVGRFPQPDGPTPTTEPWRPRPARKRPDRGARPRAPTERTPTAKVTTTDHWVRHTSTVPANKGGEVEPFVRERNGTPPGQKRKPVLMLHGRSVPVLPGFGLRYKDYGWAGAPARAGRDVFLRDLQGSGLSARPERDDLRNVNPLRRNLLRRGRRDSPRARRPVRTSCTTPSRAPTS